MYPIVGIRVVRERRCALTKRWRCPSVGAVRWCQRSALFGAVLPTGLYGSCSSHTVQPVLAVQDSRLQYDVLAACVALTAHRRFSEQFVEAGGVQLALALAR